MIRELCFFVLFCFSSFFIDHYMQLLNRSQVSEHEDLKVLVQYYPGTWHLCD